MILNSILPRIGVLRCYLIRLVSGQASKHHSSTWLTSTCWMLFSSLRSHNPKFLLQSVHVHDVTSGRALRQVTLVCDASWVHGSTHWLYAVAQIKHAAQPLSNLEQRANNLSELHKWWMDVSCTPTTAADHTRAFPCMAELLTQHQQHQPRRCAGT